MKKRKPRKISVQVRFSWRELAILLDALGCYSSDLYPYTELKNRIVFAMDRLDKKESQ